MANGGAHVWQGRPLRDLPTDELVAIAQLLSGYLSERTGELDIPARAYARLDREQLCERVAAMDRALERHRPLTARRLTHARPPAGPEPVAPGFAFEAVAAE